MKARPHWNIETFRPYMRIITHRCRESASVQRKEMVPDRTCIVQVCFILLAGIAGAEENESQDRRA